MKQIPDFLIKRRPHSPLGNLGIAGPCLPRWHCGAGGGPGGARMSGFGTPVMVTGFLGAWRLVTSQPLPLLVPGVPAGPLPRERLVPLLR